MKVNSNYILKTFNEENKKFIEKGLCVTSIRITKDLFTDLDSAEFVDIIDFFEDFNRDFDTNFSCLFIRSSFEFDSRELPHSFMGMAVHHYLDEETVPDELTSFSYSAENKESLNPHILEKYVLKHQTRLRRVLGNRFLTNVNLLSALVGRSFEEHKWHWIKREREEMVSEIYKNQKI